MAQTKPSLNEILIAAQRRMAAKADRIARPAFEAYLRADEEVIAALLAEDSSAAPSPALAPEQRRRARGTSAETDRNATEARRLFDGGLTQAQIAERMSVSLSTVKRWLRRAREL